MAEEKAAAEAPAKSSLIGKLIPVLIVVLAAGGGAFAFYKFWMVPRLSGEAKAEETHSEEESEKIPETAKTVGFDEFMVTVLKPEGASSAPLLIFSVSFLCSNEETAKLVERDKDYFKEMLNKLHSYKTREELDDPSLKENIKKEALRLANERLHKLETEPKEENKILDVYHTKFTVIDQE